MIRTSPNVEKFELKVKWNPDIVRKLNQKFKKGVSCPFQHPKVGDVMVVKVVSNLLGTS